MGPGGACVRTSADITEPKLFGHWTGWVGTDVFPVCISVRPECVV